MGEAKGGQLEAEAIARGMAAFYNASRLFAGGGELHHDAVARGVDDAPAMPEAVALTRSRRASTSRAETAESRSVRAE